MQINGWLGIKCYGLDYQATVNCQKLICVVDSMRVHLNRDLIHEHIRIVQ
jgi:hypothetical protein